jgi:hypothetical protein
MEQFDKQVRQRVFEQTEVSEDVVLALHHAFHWVFFDYSKESKSLFQYSQGARNGESAKARLRRQCVGEDIDFYTGLVLEEYGDYMRARIENIRGIVNSFISIPLQEA